MYLSWSLYHLGFVSFILILIGILWLKIGWDEELNKFVILKKQGRWTHGRDFSHVLVFWAITFGFSFFMAFNVGAPQDNQLRSSFNQSLDSKPIERVELNRPGRDTTRESFETTLQRIGEIE